MRSRGTYFSTFLGAGLLMATSPSLAADSKSSSGVKGAPVVQGETRFIPEALPQVPPEWSEPNEPQGKSTTPPSHTKGGRPSTPRSTLPENVPLSEPNPNARRSVAEGATKEELSATADDKELRALHAAERVLFPETLRGVRTSWSFDVPEPTEEESRTLGLPFTITSSMVGTGVSKDDLAWLSSLTLPDLPIQLDRRVVTYLKFYRDSDRGRTIAAIWTRKSGRYIAEIKAKLRRAGLPTDLAWLSMIESGHNPTIRSPVGATGLWQFMPDAGKMYGLTIDRWVDERQDPARSTQAAIRFLSDLHSRFGNWELAMGAYNMGYSGMSAAIAKYNTNDYWALSRMESGIPWETTLYVPKIFALAIVMNNREAFGVGRQKLDPAESFDTILLEPATSLAQTATLAGLTLPQLQGLNPQYLTDRLPPRDAASERKWPVRVPLGTSDAVLRKLSGGGAQLATYRTRLGDSPATIAVDYGVRLSDLERENAMSDDEELEPGTVLVLPPGAKKLKSEGLNDVVVSRVLAPGPGQQTVYYRVIGPELLSEIAVAFGVTEADLARWNRLRPTAHLRKDMTLQILVDKSRKLDAVRHIVHQDARVFLAGSSEFHEYFEGLKGKKRVQITVAAGDTLSGIGAKYGMSVGSMERVNRRSRDSKLIVGERLIVYTAVPVKIAAADGGREDLPSLSVPHPELLPSDLRP